MILHAEGIEIDGVVYELFSRQAGTVCGLRCVVPEEKILQLKSDKDISSVKF